MPKKKYIVLLTTQERQDWEKLTNKGQAAVGVLVGIATFPLEPAIATIIALYIIKVSLNIFCEYTQTSK